MKKRILALALAVCMLAALLPQAALTAHAARSDTDVPYAVEGGNLYFNKAAGAITGCDETVTRAEIPTEIDGFAVNTIGDYAFYSCNSLTSVSIPNVVTSIRDNAFNGCSGLTSVTIPNSVVSIGDYAFSYCDSLTSITIPDGVTKIGNGAFECCTSLTSVTIGNSVARIGFMAFSLCTSLTSVVVPNSVTIIQNGTFSNCTGLTSVVIPGGITAIRESAFDGCTSLTSITIPDSVTTIGNSAFSYCNGLTSVTIGNGVTSIGKYAFRDCGSLTAARFRGNAPEMGKDVFSIDWDSRPNPNLTIYYVEGKVGWTTPTWYGYPTATWKAFDDVKPGAWYYNAVNFAATHNLFNGTSATMFSPSQSMTRGMLVTVLWRLAGEPAPKAAATFSDIDAGRYFAKAVAWASENGIVNGMGNNLFKPNSDVTREQAATFLYRYAQYKDYDTTARADLSQFPDADQVSNFAKESLSWANAKGLINGKKNTATGVISLAPKGNATRAELATILMNFIQNVEA